MIWIMQIWTSVHVPTWILTQWVAPGLEPSNCLFFLNGLVKRESLIVLIVFRWRGGPARQLSGLPDCVIVDVSMVHQNEGPGHFSSLARCTKRGSAPGWTLNTLPSLTLTHLGLVFWWQVRRKLDGAPKTPPSTLKPVWGPWNSENE